MGESDSEVAQRIAREDDALLAHSHLAAAIHALILARERGRAGAGDTAGPSRSNDRPASTELNARSGHDNGALGSPPTAITSCSFLRKERDPSSRRGSISASPVVSPMGLPLCGLGAAGGIKKGRAE